MELSLNALDGLDAIAQSILAAAGARRKFALYGEIGAGKTTLTQAICKQLGVRDAVLSPTFALVNEYGYLDASGQLQPIYHLDLYRLKSLQEALDIGIEELLYDERYCFIEWPELVEALLPEDTMRIKIVVEENSSRKIVFL